MTHFLESIPDTKRIPAHVNDQELLDHLHNRWNRSDKEFLFEYNPSLVVLPPGAKAQLHHNVTLQREAVYLASFRTTHANGCFSAHVYQTMPRDMWKDIKGYEYNYVALALLRADLSVLAEVVVDLWPSPLSLQPFGQVLRQPRITDYRLFASRNTLYWNINARPVHVAPFALVAPNDFAQQQQRGSSGSDQLIPQAGTILPNRYGGGFHVKFLGNMTSIWEGGISGKNYGLVQTTELRDEDVLVEVNTSPKHTIQRISLDQYDMLNSSYVARLLVPMTPEATLNYMDTPQMQKSESPVTTVRRRRNRAVGERFDTQTPSSNFATVDKLWFPSMQSFSETSHGGACCVEIEAKYFRDDPSRKESAVNNNHLLVGVAHTKVSWRPWYKKDSSKHGGLSPQEKYRILPPYTYVSFFYAFEPTAPYSVLYKSGYFCFGHADEESANPYTSMSAKIIFWLNGVSFNCPKIHFVSSVTPKVDDDRKVIVSYGINDCLSRMVEIDKSDIAHLLIHGPTDNQSAT